MKSIFLIILIFYSFYSCKVDNEANNKIIVSDSKNDIRINDTINSVKKSEIASNIGFDSCYLINNFFTFYEKNYLTIYEEDIVNYQNQSIDFKKVNTMFNKLKINEYFTQSFEIEYLKHLKNIDTEINTIKTLTEVPKGLDYDYILRSQDVDELLALIASAKYKCSKECGYLKIIFTNTHTIYIDIKENKIDKI